MIAVQHACDYFIIVSFECCVHCLSHALHACPSSFLTTERHLVVGACLSVRPLPPRQGYRCTGMVRTRRATFSRRCLMRSHQKLPGRNLAARCGSLLRPPSPEKQQRRTYPRHIQPDQAYAVRQPCADAGVRGGDGTGLCKSDGDSHLHRHPSGGLHARAPHTSAATTAVARAGGYCG